MQTKNEVSVNMSKNMTAVTCYMLGKTRSSADYILINKGSVVTLGICFDTFSKSPDDMKYYSITHKS